MFTEENEPTVTQQLIENSKKQNISTVAVMQVDKHEVHKYGIIKHQKLDENRYKIVDVVEKPKAENAPSQLALPGRYVFSANIFNHLENLKPSVRGEIDLTDAMTELSKNQGLEAITFNGKRYDAGDKFGFIKANIEFALRHPEIKDQVKNYLKNLKLS